MGAEPEGETPIDEIMAWYQQLTPEDDRPPRPNEDPGEAAPEIAGFLTVLIVLNVIGALAALFANVVIGRLNRKLVLLGLSVSNGLQN